jgi:hypothetical protein
LLKTHFLFLFFRGKSSIHLRLYRKYKREQITRKILEYEAEMERGGADEDNRASRRYQASSASSSSSEESYRHHKRGRRSARKSGKKVRARSRPPVDRKKSTEKTPESSPIAVKPPALPPKESKKTKQEAKNQDEQKQGSYHHFRHGNGKARFELIRDSGLYCVIGVFLIQSESKRAKRSFASKFLILFSTRSFVSRFNIRFARSFVPKSKRTNYWSLDPQGLISVFSLDFNALIFFRSFHVGPRSTRKPN